MDREAIDLHDQINGGGSVIGSARVYAFNATDASYSGDETQFDLYLYDVQTYTQLTTNQQLTTAQAPVGS